MAKFRKPRMRSYEALMKKSEKELKRTYKKLYKQVYNQRRYLVKKGEAVDWKFDESYKAVRGNKSSYASKIIKLLERQRLQTYTTKGINKRDEKVAKNLKFKVNKKNEFYTEKEGIRRSLTKEQVNKILRTWGKLTNDSNFKYDKEQYENLLNEAIEKEWYKYDGDDLYKIMEQDLTSDYDAMEQKKIEAYQPEGDPFRIYS